jgi:Ca2+-binding EF-hand superfamily protein
MEEIHKFVSALSRSAGVVHKKDVENLKTNLDRINSRLATLEDFIKVESESTRLPKLFSKALSKMEVLEHTVKTHVNSDGWVTLPQAPPDALSPPQKAAQSLKSKLCGALGTAVDNPEELSLRAIKLFAEFDQQASGKLMFETLLRGWNSVLQSKLSRLEVEVFMAASKSSSQYLDQQSFVRAVLVVVRSKQGGEKAVLHQSAFAKQLLQHVGSANNSRAIKALFEQMDGPEKYGKIDVNAVLDWAESKGITVTEQEAADFIAIGETTDSMLDVNQFEQAVQRLLGTSAAGARAGSAGPVAAQGLSTQALGASQRGRGGPAPTPAEPIGRLMTSSSRAMGSSLRSSSRGRGERESALRGAILQHVSSGSDSRAIKALFEQMDGPEKYGTIDVNAVLDWAESKGITVTEQEAADFIATGETTDSMLDVNQFEQAVQRLLGTSAAGARAGSAGPNAAQGPTVSVQQALTNVLNGEGHDENGLAMAAEALFDEVDEGGTGLIDASRLTAWLGTRGQHVQLRDAAAFVDATRRSSTDLNGSIDLEHFTNIVRRALRTFSRTSGTRARGASAFAGLVNSQLGSGDVSQSSLKLFREVDSEQLGTIDNAALVAWASRLKVDVDVQDVERFIESANPGTCHVPVTVVVGYPVPLRAHRDPPRRPGSRFGAVRLSRCSR